MLFQKHEVIKDILDGFELEDLVLKYKSRKALSARLNQWFGHANILQIRVALVSSYLEKCFKRGYSRQEALDYLVKSGFNMFSKSTRSNLQKLSPKQNRWTIDAIFNKILDTIYGIPLMRAASSNKGRYDQILKKEYLSSFVNYLYSLGISNMRISERLRDDVTGQFIEKDVSDINYREFCVVEHLLIKGYKQTDIAISIFDEITIDSSPEVKRRGADRIRNYLENRYRKLLEQAGIKYSINNLVTFLRSKCLNDDTYNNYLNGVI